MMRLVNSSKSSLKLRSSRRGFTIVELLVVIAIIGVLAGIATPMALNVLKDAKRTAAINEARQMETAGESFLESYQILPYNPEVAMSNEANPYVTNATEGVEVLNHLLGGADKSLNYKGIAFYSPKNGIAPVAGVGGEGAVYNAGNDTIITLHDGEGIPFRVILNLDYNQHGTLPEASGTGGVAPTGPVSRIAGKNILVFHYGLDREWSTSDDVKTY